MPTLLFQVVTLVFDLVIIVFAGVYLLGVRRKEKEIDKREGKLDNDYRQVVGQGMQREQQILENAINQSSQMMQVATHQANQIIAGTQYISQGAKATLDTALQKMVSEVQTTGSTSKIALEQALQKMVVDAHREAFDTGKDFNSSYTSSLKQLTTVSLNGFQNVTNELELELQKQIKEFRSVLLTNMEKEIDEYKLQKIRRIEQASNVLVQKVAEEILNKSLSLEDHQNLVIQSLEKAKKEGIFD
jgi:hypothetical protein